MTLESLINLALEEDEESKYVLKQVKQKKNIKLFFSFKTNYFLRYLKL